MPQTKVTSQQVAKQAGVSQSAVSRVFTPGASASPQTVAKVKKAAAALGYRPNVLARSLITGKSRIIGLVVAYLDNQFYPEALERLSNALQARGYHVLMFMASNSEDRIDRVIDEILDYQADGIIMASVALSSQLASRCQAANVPVVLFNRGQDGSEVSMVTSANRDGGQKVAEYLIAGGHQRIAHIAGWEGSSTGRDRARGFREGLASHGADPLAVVDGKYDRDLAADAAERLMDRSDPPDAIFVGNDHMAFAVLDRLRVGMGVDVPGDVSIIGYDDVPLASWPAYDLTTVRQPVNRMVEATVDTLIHQIEQVDRPTQRIEIDGPLIERATAKRPEEWNT